MKAVRRADKKIGGVAEAEADLEGVRQSKQAEGNKRHVDAPFRPSNTSLARTFRHQVFDE